MSTKPITFEIRISEREVRPSFYEGQSAESVEETERIWQNQGQYCNYLHARLLDGNMHSAVESAQFRRDGAGALTREDALRTMMAMVTDNLTHRMNSVDTQPEFRANDLAIPPNERK